MPWTEDDFPGAMTDLEPAIRSRAISRANDLVASGHDDRQAVEIALTEANDRVRSTGVTDDLSDGFGADSPTPQSNHD